MLLYTQLNIISHMSFIAFHYSIIDVWSLNHYNYSIEFDVLSVISNYYNEGSNTA